MDAVPGLVRLASRLRGERVIHAKGRTFTGRLDVTGADVGVPLLDRPTSHDVLLRLSRGAGPPDVLPDALGLAVRILDAHGPGQHQDLLLTTGARGPVLRHGLWPRRDVLGSTYTSIAPYRLAGQPWLLAALPAAETSGPRSVAALAPEQVRFDLAVGRTTGAWRPWGRLSATGTADGGRRVRFSPEVTGAGIVPPWLAVRGDGAYPSSHVAADEVSPAPRPS